MSLTGAQLLTGFSKFVDDHEAGTTTSAGASDGSTLIDSGLGKRGEGYFTGFWVRLTGSTNQYEVARVTKFESSTGTLTVSPEFTTQAATSETYELHRFEPERKFEVLDEARVAAFPDIFKLMYDETVTTDGQQDEYPIPASIRVGPAMVWVEAPIAADATWNFIQDPRNDSTANFTDSNVTATTVSKRDGDLLIPKYDDTCTKLVVSASTAATYSQVVGSMTNGITAALAAGREMTFGAWIYSTVASKVTLTLTDDTAASTSSEHQGLGWEFLAVTRDIVHTNATTLTVAIAVDNDTNAATIFVNRMWLMYGPLIPAQYHEDAPLTVRRDDATQRILLPIRIRGRRQLRMVGKALLSALGTSASTQVTNTMELDEANAGLLYSKAAELLYQGEGLNVEDVARVAGNMAEVASKGDELRSAFQIEVPQIKLQGPYDN